MAETVFYRPERDARFFGWTHNTLRIPGVSYSVAENAVILTEAAASLDPPG